MESTSVEDFQVYHNHQPVGEVADTVRTSPRPLYESLDGIHHDNDDDEASLSGSAQHSSGPDEAVFDHPSRASSPCTSNSSEDEISTLESNDEPESYDSPSSTPLKTRSPFRNPSSVRAMQMETTPPHLASPSSQQRHKLYTPSRQCTPRSNRSDRSAMSSPKKLSPTKKLKKEYPLVLLHVTLLPIPLVYSQEVMESVLPPAILENWKLLQEKATDTVLARGILIPHPKEDYDLLEERLLESLELKIPRILKCGHFHLSPEEEADIAADSDNDDLDGDANDLDICLDCGRRVRDGKYGSAGTGSKRWDIKLFAANGLMRAGAWGAAWREMERVDVEILPWMEEDMKRELELRREEEERARAEVGEEGVGGLDDERLKEIYGGDAQAFVDGLVDETPVAQDTPKRARRSEQSRQEDVPLWDLFRDYVFRLAQDRRNIAIVFLGILVLFLSMGSFSGKRPSSEVQAFYGKAQTPVTQLTEPVPISSPTGSAILASATPVSLTSSPSPEQQPHEEPEQAEEHEQRSAWTEAAEDMVREMIED